MTSVKRSLARIAAAALFAASTLAFAQGDAGYQLDIVDPAYQSTVFSDPGDVTVSVTVVPDLANGDQVELLVDGLSAGPPSATLSFSLAGIPRGQHQLQARIIDSTGNVGSVSPSSTFYMWQASRLFPNRQGHH
jgi:hypothetical protein